MEGVHTTGGGIAEHGGPVPLGAQPAVGAVMSFMPSSIIRRISFIDACYLAGSSMGMIGGRLPKSMSMCLISMQSASLRSIPIKASFRYMSRLGND